MADHVYVPKYNCYYRLDGILGEARLIDGHGILTAMAPGPNNDKPLVPRVDKHEGKWRCTIWLDVTDPLTDWTCEADSWKSALKLALDTSTHRKVRAAFGQPQYRVQ